MKKLALLLLITFISVPELYAQETPKEKKKWKFGLHFDNLSDQQKGFNAETNGVVINRVSKDHPGEAAGVQVGDIITHIDNIAIKDQDHCVIVMRDFDTAKGFAILKIIRNGVKMDIKVLFDS